MIYLSAILSIAIFTGSLWWFGITKAAATVVETGRHAVNVMRHPDLTEDHKEREVQRASLKLFGGFASILLRSCGAIGASALPVFFFDRLNLATYPEVMELFFSWTFILSITFVLTIMYIIYRKYFELGK